MEKFATMESAVRSRYSTAAEKKIEALCCPVEYDPRYLAVLPQEIIDRDYGCGDPSQFVRPEETVLDLGSGAGKICYIAAQRVGPRGRVIGVDMNSDMLAVARRHKADITRAIGYDNVEFYKARIQDLRLDREEIDRWIQAHPLTSEDDLVQLESWQQQLRADRPLIADATVDLVVSNCVLNLVNSEEKPQLFREIFRVLRSGGRAVISDIVCDEEVPEALRKDPELWSGCISGALREDQFIESFEAAGFYGVEILSRGETPWKVIEGVEFRGTTVAAYKGKEGECWDHNEAVIYRGPFREVLDDDGHKYRRGERIAVCRKTFQILQREPYQKFFEPIRPLKEISPPEAKPFRCGGGTLLRSPRETKGLDYSLTDTASAACCEPGQCC